MSYNRLTPSAECLLALVMASGCSSQPGPSTNPRPVNIPAATNTPQDPSVLAGLTWLVRHQSHDGRWDSKDFTRQCGFVPGGPCDGPGRPDYDVGNTGLALLAFLGAGYTHESSDNDPDGKFGNAIRKGFRWLAAAQDDGGCVGETKTSVKHMYNHVIATLAFCEAYGITKSALFKNDAHKAVQYLIAAQNPGKGWRYSSRCGDSDSSLTGLCVMALKSAKDAGFHVPPSCFEGATAWFNGVTDDDGHVGYLEKPPEGETNYLAFIGNHALHETMTALGMICCVLSEGRKDAKKLKRGKALLMKDLPKQDPYSIDFYYWLQGTIALRLLDGPEDRHWETWRRALLNAMDYDKQRNQGGCRAGSWEPADKWSLEKEAGGGRVYSTAINTLTLEICHGYKNVFCIRKP